MRWIIIEWEKCVCLFFRQLKLKYEREIFLEPSWAHKCKLDSWWQYFFRGGQCVVHWFNLIRTFLTARRHCARGPICLLLGHIDVIIKSSQISLTAAELISLMIFLIFSIIIFFSSYRLVLFVFFILWSHLGSTQNNIH